MAHWRTYTSNTTVKSRYDWCWLRKGNNGKHNRKAVRFMSANYYIPVMIFTASLQSPPSGPPTFSL